MGLDTTHNCWHGPYSSFARFREKLAMLIGLDLNNFCGYNNNAENCIMMSRNTINHDIYPLLNHSDCDGVLLLHESESIVDGLNDILLHYINLKYIDSDLYDRIIQFRDGCLLAISKKEVIIFR